MILLGLVLIGCWSLCSLSGNNADNTGLTAHLLDRFENVKEIVGMETLLYHHKIFYLSDYDDDGVIEYTDILTATERSDTNKDGVWTWEEVQADPDFQRVRKEEFLLYDHNGDGMISVIDARLLFEMLPGSGYELDLEEYLTLHSTIRNQSQGPEINIKAFVHAEKDFRILDMDDDWILTRKEFRMRFIHADRNKDGKLMGSEIRNLFPMRSTPPTNICGNSDTGCSEDDVMMLFDSAEKEKDSELSSDEYFRHFGPLIGV